MRNPILIAIFALVSLTLVVACGGSDDNGDDAPTPTSIVDGGSRSDTSGGSAGEPGPDSPTISISSPGIDVGSEGEAVIEIVYELTPSIGAWTIDVKFDPNIASVADCDPVEGTAVCNPEYENDTVRIVGASLGIESQAVLGRITFQCDEAGESALEISIDTLADATIGDPQLLAANIEDGTVTCG